MTQVVGSTTDGQGLSGQGGPRAIELSPLRRALDVEAVRLPLEREVLAQLEALPLLAELRSSVSGSAETVRRRLMSSSVRLTAGMAPSLHEAAEEVMGLFSIGKPLEIYQREGAENASMHLVPEPVLLEVRGRLITLLEPGSTRALIGHELGHYLAHGAASPLGRSALLANVLTQADGVPDTLRSLGSKLSMAQELTADRFGLLACQSLDAALRLEMICTTGLPGSALTWDTDAYLAQCRELIELYLREGASAQGVTHPEHSLRAYAAWMFSETTFYRDLTGKGPGTRSLDEVNAHLRTCLGADVLSSGEHMLQQPPEEMHACALAACVLVAAADGEIADQEVEVIERVFAPLVPDAARYLDVDEAIRRFSQLAPVVAAMGAGVHRSLFSLLVHIVAADGVIDKRELVAVLRIGEAIGAAPFYERLLTSVMRSLTPAGASPQSGSGSGSGSLTLALSVSVSIGIEIPLPPRPGEGIEALDSYVRGVVARGGGDTSLRRLFHLLGQRGRSAEALDLVNRTLLVHSVRCELDLSAVDDLDAVIRLWTDTPAPASGQLPARSASVDPTNQKLIRAIAKLRDRLVSGDGRSPSIRMHDIRPGRGFDLKTLDRVSLGLGERALATVRGGTRAQLVEAHEAGRHSGSARVADELLDLQRTHRARREETGANELALGYPFLIGNAGGYLVRGPLVLFPVELECKEAGARTFSLKPVADAVPIVNLPLLRLIFGKRDLALPDSLVAELDELAADPQRAPEGLLARLDQLGLSAAVLSGSLQPVESAKAQTETWQKDQLEVQECAVLGLFPLSNSDLLQDYDVLVAELGRGASPAALLGSASAVLPAELRAALGFDDAQATPDATRLVPVIAADPAQRDVLRRARTARALVVDGPPGAGKSQVIVNLVADAIGRGERVAVVSEKRAALDVVAQRLEHAGLAHATALVHDVQDDRKPLYARIAARLEQPPVAHPETGEVARTDAQVREATGVLEERASLLGRRIGAGGPSVGMLHAAASGFDLPPLAGAPSTLAALEVPALRLLGAAMEELARHASFFVPGSMWNRRDRGSLAGWSPERVVGMTAQLGRAIETARQLDQELTAAGGASLLRLTTAAPLLDAARATRALRSSAEDQLLFVRTLARLEAGEPPDGLMAAEREAQASESALATVPRRPAIVLDAAAQAHVTALLVWLGRWWRFFIPAYWRAKAAVQEAAVRLWPDRAATAIDAALAREVLASAQVGRVLSVLDAALDGLGLRHLSPQTPAGALPLATRISDMARRLGPLAAGRSSLAALGLWPGALSVEGLAPWDKAVDAGLRAIHVGQIHEGELAPCRAVFTWLDVQTGADALSTLRTAFNADGDRLVRADDRLAAARVLFPDADALVAAAAASLPAGDSERWRRAVARTWVDAVLRRELAACPQLAMLSGSPTLAEIPPLEDRLREAWDASRDAERTRVVAKLDAVEILQAPLPEKGRRRTEVQGSREAMLKEAKKQRNVMPLRTFVRQFSAKGLLDVTPVWLLSPETMTVLFPREPLFDLVIFDEASQCTVESGLPALLRAKRFVVAGDEKQMPPSSFFRAAVQEGADEEPEAEHREAAEVFDAESLLSLARQRVEAAPLRWHYRCLSEELIAFSNHAMYGGDLLTIPSTASRTAPAAIRWITVENGRSDGGENLVEASRVVDELASLLRPPSGAARAPSVGVVTMNVPQRKAILDAIDARRLVDRAFAAVWDDATAAERLDERPFVKNIENVQGDERDVIVFSLGYAPVERVTRKGTDRVVPARFGPIGQRGGERRLNVAISRAKRACVIIASFEPSMLSVARTQNPGPKLFKQFLEFAHHNAGAIERSPTRSSPWCASPRPWPGALAAPSFCPSTCRSRCSWRWPSRNVALPAIWTWATPSCGSRSPSSPRPMRSATWWRSSVMRGRTTSTPTSATCTAPGRCVHAAG
jgi:hypothetical protein